MQPIDPPVAGELNEADHWCIKSHIPASGDILNYYRVQFVACFDFKPRTMLPDASFRLIYKHIR